MSIRDCPACGRHYTPDYADTFCLCGVELVPAPTTSEPAVTVPAPTPPVPVPLPTSTAPVPVPLPAPRRPPAGTRCLVLYGPDREVLRYFPLTKDVTVIGRLDVVEANFPDIDLRDCLDEA